MNTCYWHLSAIMVVDSTIKSKFRHRQCVGEMNIVFIVLEIGWYHLPLPLDALWHSHLGSFCSELSTCHVIAVIFGDTPLATSSCISPCLCPIRACGGGGQVSLLTTNIDPTKTIASDIWASIHTHRPKPNMNWLLLRKKHLCTQAHKPKERCLWPDCGYACPCAHTCVSAHWRQKGYLNCTNAVCQCRLVYYILMFMLPVPFWPSVTDMIYLWLCLNAACTVPGLSLDYASACSFCSSDMLLSTLAWLLTTLQESMHLCRALAPLITW